MTWEYDRGFFFLTLPTRLSCCVSVLEQTTLFWCVCIMYCTCHVFDQVNIPWSLHLNQDKKVATKSKYVIYFFVSMLFYIFQHGLIPVSIFVLHLYFLLFRVLKCLQIFAIYYRWDFFFLIVSIKQVKGCLSSHIHVGGSPP